MFPGIRRRSTSTTCSGDGNGGGCLGDGDSGSCIGGGGFRARIGVGISKTDCGTGGNNSHVALAAKDCRTGVTSVERD